MNPIPVESPSRQQGEFLRQMFHDEEFLQAVVADFIQGNNTTTNQAQYLERKWGINSLEKALEYDPLVASLWNAIMAKQSYTVPVSPNRPTVKDKQGNTILVKPTDPHFYNCRHLVVPAPQVPLSLQLVGADYYRQLELCIWEAQMHNLDTLPKDMLQEQLGLPLKDILSHPDVADFLAANKYQVVNRDCNIAYLRDISNKPAYYFIGLFYVGETRTNQLGLRYPSPVPFS
jgi:hypothetical protein